MHGEASGPAQSTRLERTADRLASYAWRGLIIVIVLAFIGGVVSAGPWFAGTANAPAPAVDACENPPCGFSFEGPLTAADLLVIIPLLGYLVVILLGIPSLLVGSWDLLRRRWSAGGRRLLPFFGPVLVFVGMEIVPHVLSPCLLAGSSDAEVVGICERTAHDPGLVDVAARWHALQHTLVGALPMTALYWLALRKWRPDAIRSGLS